MKVLHVNCSDKYGGAARAAYRLHHAMVENGIDSEMLVLKNETKEWRINSFGNFNWIYRTGLAFIEKKICNYFGGVETTYPWSVGLIDNSKFIDYINNSMVDVVNLHWVNGGCLSVNNISQIKKPIVWTLHDSWAFTGGCHIPYDCEKYKIDCSGCKHFRTVFGYDYVNAIFRKKEKSYPASMVIVCPSRWLLECSHASNLFRHRTLYNIANTINTNMYKPIEKKTARRILNLDENKKYILFGAMDSTSDPNKGFSVVYNALNKLWQSQKNVNTELLIFGGATPKESIDFGFKCKYFGRLYDDVSLNLLYSSADVMLVPSYSENFPNTILESMSSGTPCVAFDIGGIPDQIDHGVNGYLAQPFDISDFINGIKCVLMDSNGAQKYSNSARRKVVQNFSNTKIAGQYLRVYSTLCSN